MTKPPREQGARLRPADLFGLASAGSVPRSGRDHEKRKTLTGGNAAKAPYEEGKGLGEGGSLAAPVASAQNLREQGKSRVAARRPKARELCREANCWDRMKNVFIGRLLYRRLTGRRRPAAARTRMGGRRRRPWRQEALLQKKLQKFL
jgi:hypothetical protein